MLAAASEGAASVGVSDDGPEGLGIIGHFSSKMPQRNRASFGLNTSLSCARRDSPNSSLISSNAGHTNRCSADSGHVDFSSL